MKTAATQRKLKDEIKEQCTACGIERLVAYWDYELEYYIYLSESSGVCNKCEASLECEPC